MKSKKTTESTQTTTPFAQPELQFALGENRNLFNLLSGREAPDFATTVPFSNETNTAFDLIVERALGGNAAVDAGEAAVTDIASGGILGDSGNFFTGLATADSSNPLVDLFLPTASGEFLDPTANPLFDLGASAVNDSVSSIFERAGRTGSQANQTSVSRGIGDLTAKLLDTERNRQLSAASTLGQLSLGAGSILNADARTRLAAAGLSPAFAAEDFRNLNALLGVGGAKEAKAREELNEDLFRFNFPFENQIQATQLLNAGVGGLGPLLGSTTEGKTVETSQGSLFNTLLGGLLTGGSIAFGGGGLGAGAGAGASIFNSPIPSQIASQAISQALPAPVPHSFPGFNPSFFTPGSI